MVGVKKEEDLLAGVLRAMVFENFHVRTRRIILAKLRSETNLAMNDVVVPDESANETNHNDWRICGNFSGGTRGNILPEAQEHPGEQKRNISQRPSQLTHGKRNLHCRELESDSDPLNVWCRS